MQGETHQTRLCRVYRMTALADRVELGLDKPVDQHSTTIMPVHRARGVFMTAVLTRAWPR